MSKRRKKVNETVDTTFEEVAVETETEETNEKETEEMTEKKEGFAFKIGAGIGKAVGATKRVLTSKPAKIIYGVAAIGGSLAAGYCVGKNGLPDLGSDADDFEDFDDFDSEEFEETENSTESEE